MFADDYLGYLVGDFWRNGLKEVFYPYGHRKTVPITREQVWRLLGDSKPPAFRDINEPEEPNWEELAKARPCDYRYGLPSPGLQNTVLAQLLLPAKDAKSWIVSRDRKPYKIRAIEWEARQRTLMEERNLTYRDAAKIIAQEVGLKFSTIERETRKVRHE